MVKAAEELMWKRESFEEGATNGLCFWCVRGATFGRSEFTGHERVERTAVVGADPGCSLTTTRERRTDRSFDHWGPWMTLVMSRHEIIAQSRTTGKIRSNPSN